MSIRMHRQMGTLPVSEAELVRMAHDLDAVHQDASLPAPGQSVGEWVGEWVDTNHEHARADGPRRASRRTFLMGTEAAIGGGVLLAACGSSSPSKVAPAPISADPAT